MHIKTWPGKQNKIFKWKEKIRMGILQRFGDFTNRSYPIKNVWDIVERRIRKHSPLPSNLQDIKSCIANAWYSLDVNAIQKLVDSIPKWIRAVIHAKGGPIKYWSWISNSLASVCVNMYFYLIDNCLLFLVLN